MLDDVVNNTFLPRNGILQAHGRQQTMLELDKFVQITE